MRMGLREANQRFSALIRAVRRGQEVVLTERGKPIAVVRPLPEGEGVFEALTRLARGGVLQAGKHPGPLPSWKPARIKGKPITATLREERDLD
jgi:prevent-host-death family protein